MRILASILFGLALVLILAGIQRGRFRSRGGGQGVVQVVEGQVRYFGPLNGGAVSMSELALQIPVSAEGADLLFDAFTGLEGLRIEHLLRIKQADERQLQVVWRRRDVQARINTLH